ncbi:MAG TPA: hypothetical protein VGV93_12135 [Acidimicrobiales bacterium]|nr:hypothetical protein [Acidimicrobiales bacterium]
MREDELGAAAANGVLVEGHYLDIKRELPSGRGANRELARDLASFAIDGGLYIIGVDEATSPPTLHPVPLSHPALAERVEQVALTALDPPLVVRTHQIPASRQPGEGYLIVGVPPSPTAPHMVDHEYWARGDKTKYRLSDPEVLRLHERRRAREGNVLAQLEELVANDPVPSNARQLAHLFLLGTPVPGRDAMLLNVVGDDGWQRRLLELVHGALVGAGVTAGGPAGFSPGIEHATQVERRPGGWSLSSGFDPGRQFPPNGNERHLLELQLGEDGALELFCGRGSYIRGPGEEGPGVIFEHLIVGQCRQLLAVAVAVSDASGYFGSWDFGVVVTGLRGGVSSVIANAFGWTATPYTTDNYRASSRSSLEELRSRPSVVADRLVGKLVRALGTRTHPSVASLLDP